MIKENEETINGYKYEYSVFKDKIREYIEEKDFLNLKLTIIDIIYTVKFGQYILLNLLDIAKKTLSESETIDEPNRDNLFDLFNDKIDFLWSEEFKGIYTSFLNSSGYILEGDDNTQAYLDTYSVSGCRTLEPETCASMILDYSDILNSKLEEKVSKTVKKFRDKVFPLVHAIDIDGLELLKYDIIKHQFLGIYVIKDLLVELSLFLKSLPNSRSFSSLIGGISTTLTTYLSDNSYKIGEFQKELNKIYPTLYPFDSAMFEAYSDRLLTIYNNLALKRLNDYGESVRVNLFCSTRTFISNFLNSTKPRSRTQIMFPNGFTKELVGSTVKHFKNFLKILEQTLYKDEETLLGMLRSGGELTYFGRIVTYYLFDVLIKNDLSTHTNHKFVEEIITIFCGDIKFDPKFYNEIRKETGYLEHELDKILYDSLVKPFI